MDRVSMKIHAKKQIEGKIFMLLAISIIIYAAMSVIGLILGPFAFLMTLVVTGPVEFAMAYIYLGVTKKSRMPKIEDTIVGFKGNDFSRSFVGYLRYFVFTFLWSLLFVIPGIIKSFSYSQMFYLMVDDEDLDPAEAQRKSMELMDGHKLDLFVLGLSFLPWCLLGVITLGLAFIWVIPYMSTTMAEFHVRLVNGGKPSAKKTKKEEKEDEEDASELDEAVEDMKKAVGKAGNAVKKSASKAVANAAESVEKSAKQIKKDAKKASKK